MHALTNNVSGSVRFAATPEGYSEDSFQLESIIAGSYSGVGSSRSRMINEEIGVGSSTFSVH